MGFNNFRSGTTLIFFSLFSLVLLATTPSAKANDTADPSTNVAYGRGWKYIVEQVNDRKVVAAQDSQSTKFDFGFKVDAGYFADSNSTDGLAHLAEHMIAHGRSLKFSESLSRWRKQDQGRSLWFHTDGTYTDFCLSADTAEAPELLARFDEAISRTDYTEEDVKEQLSEISHDRERFEKSVNGIVSSSLGRAANPAHPYHRVFTSGGEELLKAIPIPSLVNQVNQFLQSNYTGNQSAIVVISPLPPKEAMALVRSGLPSVFATPRSERPTPQYRGSAAFNLGGNSALHQAQYKGASDRLVFEYALPNRSLASTPTALELMEFALTRRDGTTLATQLTALRDVEKVDIETTYDEFDGADELRVSLSTSKLSVKRLEQISSVLRAEIRNLAFVDRAQLIARFVDAKESQVLLGAQPSRENFIFDALEAVAKAGSTNFDYRTEVTDQDWADFKHLQAEATRQNPIRIRLIGSSTKKEPGVEKLSTTKNPSTLIGALPSAVERHAAASCIASNPEVPVSCFRPVWGVTAIRGQPDFVDGLERTIATALLLQTKQTLDNLIDSQQLALQVSAGEGPGIAVYGYGKNRTEILQKSWTEFLRPRTQSEIKEIKSQIASEPRSAFDRALSESSDLLQFTDSVAAKNTHTLEEIDRKIDAMQARFRLGETENFTADKTMAVLDNEQNRGDVGENIGPLLRRSLSSSFGVSSYLSLNCEIITPRLQKMLRLISLPSHRVVWNSARQSDDSSAFGAYVVREFGARICHGISLDSSDMNAAEFENLRLIDAQAIERLFCESPDPQLENVKILSLRDEGRPWSKEQALDLKDAQNWMRTRRAVLAVREVGRQANDFQRNEVCDWVTTHVSKSAGTNLNVLVTRSK